MNSAAKYLPMTIPVRLAGDVSRSCSVPFLRSSASNLMVRIGTVNKYCLHVPTVTLKSVTLYATLYEKKKSPSEE